jgi:hypothetical protein
MKTCSATVVMCSCMYAVMGGAVAAWGRNSLSLKGDNC